MSLAGALARICLRACRWRILDVPERPPRAVVIAYPHTSNWDFVWAILGLFALEVKPRWVAKDSLFRGPFGWFMYALGGIPVNRRERTGFVGRMAEEAARHQDFLLCIAPEGTRGLTEGWKSGFYRIALAASLPVLAATIDYPKRELGLLRTLHLSGEMEADLAALRATYAGRLGHTPDQASPIKLLS